jgi:hypothetical protein
LIVLVLIIVKLGNTKKPPRDCISEHPRK